MTLNFEFARESWLGDVARVYDAAFPSAPPIPEAAELRDLVERAGRLMASRHAPGDPRPLSAPLRPDGTAPLILSE